MINRAQKAKFFEKAKKMLDKRGRMCYNMPVAKKDGLVAQLVRALACHARGRGFEPHPGRHFLIAYASVAQLVEQGTENPRVVGSIPTGGTTYLRI